MTLKQVAGTLVAAGALLLASCGKEPPARTVVEFVDNPRLLEAAVLRCAENRLELKYTQECLNAREAVDRIAAREDAANRQQLDAQSDRKREALRRSQEAAAAARERVEEMERQRREAEYLGQFESLPDETPDDQQGTSNAPGYSSATDNDADDDTRNDRDQVTGDDTTPPPADSAAAPPADNTEAPPDERSLEAVREELRRRQETDNQ